MKADNIASYVLEDIVKQSPKTKTGVQEFIVLKKHHDGVNTRCPIAEVEVLGSTRYTSHTEAFTAALEDANSETAGNECCSVVKNCKVEGTGVCIAVVLLGERMRTVCSYRIVQLP